ncbi:type II toxin-antitoxin system CcdA family antitoxin [Phenylobacterium sp.]|uniref:Type II toxin-antitoxin system CcdA family antitoxin n=1 Tax=Phenylobacterium ferrooxidans TaxID=2982689 RepID=A0ABW6CUK0_9CAUL|nr:type II toxin-antitoxin system CcdA family antitoxin [Phenylobacterium sp.]MDO8321574.1 type II toxin-antitoxin system CcdA family antitoxin [Phenylobacterium sp.]MDP3632405.1 type II toxin-antitoxin system CcdA family antitoxin [Phenylobacterium sp.]MDP3870725.1 type II toxin-antitoxin system CcdA family antitoxin [Phenylobacterium sp.]
MGKIELKIEIDADLLAKGQAAGLDMARTLENGIRQATRAESDEDKARRWAEENAEALKAQRERIDAHGVFGEDLRTW